MHIRPMEPSDVEGVYSLECRSFSVPWSKESIEKELANEVAQYFIAEQEGQIVGYVGVWNVVGEGSITNIAVDKAYQGQGIGKALMQEVIAYGEQISLEYILLEVRNSNTVARKLYEGLGFGEIAKRKNYYTHPTEDAIIMQMFF